MLANTLESLIGGRGGLFGADEALPDMDPGQGDAQDAGYDDGGFDGGSFERLKAEPANRPPRTWPKRPGRRGRR